MVALLSAGSELSVAPGTAGGSGSGSACVDSTGSDSTGAGGAGAASTSPLRSLSRSPKSAKFISTVALAGGSMLADGAGITGAAAVEPRGRGGGSGADLCVGDFAAASLGPVARSSTDAMAASSCASSSAPKESPTSVRSPAAAGLSSGGASVLSSGKPGNPKTVFSFSLATRQLRSRNALGSLGLSLGACQSEPLNTEF